MEGRVIREMSVHKILKFRTTSGFGKRKKYFPEEAVAHPAKINLHLLEYLIQTYTEEGENILDPMTGTGSTVVLSMLNNRNAIGVDLEEKFTGWAIQAAKNVEREQTLTLKGKGMVICGDARKLSEVLKGHEGEISSVLFSPPYAKSITPSNGDKETGKAKELGLGRKGGWGTMGGVENVKKGYSNNKENIGNLPFVDSVLLSPPLCSKHHTFCKRNTFRGWR